MFCFLKQLNQRSILKCSFVSHLIKDATNKINVFCIPYISKTKESQAKKTSHCLIHMLNNGAVLAMFNTLFPPNPSIDSSFDGLIVPQIVFQYQFHFDPSFSYVLFGDTTCTVELRKLIAQCVSSDPQTYNNVFLGRDNSDYCNWILDKEKWGGTCNLVFVHVLECRAGKYPGQVNFALKKGKVCI